MKMVKLKPVCSLNGNLFFTSTPDPQTNTVEMLACEASRKIDAIFTHLSSMLLKENQTLKAKVEKLDSELQDMTKNFENAQLWRENVLNGCPVLFEESGMIFTLKLFGQLMKNTDKLTEGVAGPTPAAVLQSGNDAGMFLQLEKPTSDIVCFQNN